MDPLMHYALHGWREMRDPSPAFSTRFYLDANADVREAGENPLRHYLVFGQKEQRDPHSLLKPLNIARPDVAIVILSFNAPLALRITLDSLIRAKVRVPFTVYLLENGSRPDVKAAVEGIVAEAQSRGLPMIFTDHPVNLGFSGGNNVCIDQALNKQHTHICILNSDVVVTEYWLDQLLDTAEPVVGPVSNAVGNEQTVPIDYSAVMDETAWPVINEFARRRRQAYSSETFTSEFLGFFCTLIRRDVIEGVGLLDERFFPGSYEDDDYCIRLRESGHQLAIARNIYIHHFGSASFSMLEFKDRLEISDINRRRFEEKHSRAWLHRTHLLLTSWAQDEARSRADDTSAAGKALRVATREAHHRTGVDLVNRLFDATEHFRREAARGPDALAKLDHLLSECATPNVEWMRDEIRRARAELLGENVPPPGMPLVSLGDSPKSLQGVGAAAQNSYAKLLSQFWHEIQSIELMSFNVLVSAQPLLLTFAKILSENDVTIVFADLNPKSCDARDGYVQRVLAMDDVMSGHSRIYILYDEAFRGLPTLETLGERQYLFRIADRAPLAEALLAALGALCRCYVHSVLRLGSETTRRYVSARPKTVIFDAHGSVPEEFQMYADPFGAQTHEAYEALLFRQAGRVICVSQAMADHMGAKHGPPHSPPIICPIFVGDHEVRPQSRTYRDRARIIYAGGTQRWQQIPKMLDLVAALRGRFDFTIYTPDPTLIRRELEARGVADDGSVVNGSVTPEAVQKALPSFDFGFLLREDTVVNRVSCPTKLVEYLMHGVVPIMEAAVGDFNAAGLCYVPLEDFRLGRLPDIHRRHEMAKANREILASMERAANQGLDEIRTALIPVRGVE